MNKPEFIKNFPYPVPRDIQIDALRVLEDSWNDHDVFIISAPTALGKTAVSESIIRALRSVSVITPTNMLVDQYLSEFPNTPTLARLDSYYCEKWDRPCSTTRGKCLQFCSMRRDGAACPASGDLSTAKYRRGPGIYNYHIYMAHKVYRDVLVVDEAHNLIPVIRDRMGIILWQHDYHYPNNMFRPEQIRNWLSSLPHTKISKSKKLQALKEAVSYEFPNYIAERSVESFSGKGTQRGQPEDRDCIRLLPVDITEAPPMMWPAEVQKIVLLSATIGPKDVEALGLEGRGKRVCYIDCASPIPPGSRPIIADCHISVNRNNMQNAVPQLAEYIQSLADQHIGEKGVIHATYQLAGLLREHLENGPAADRFIYHDRDNKAEMYKLFRDSPPEDGAILVASGMYEGLDLPQDLGRWQVVSKIPWPSLANSGISFLASRDPDWYSWECWKTLIQACGRICRTPEDFGITYIPDSSLGRLLNEAPHMMPSWYSDALVFPSK